MRIFIIAVIIGCIASPVFAAKQAKTTKPRVKSYVLKLETEEQKTLYAVGQVMSSQLSAFDLTPAELRIVKLGLTDGTRGRKPKVDLTKYIKKSQEMGIVRRDAHGKKLEAKSAEFIAAAAAEEGALKSASGVVYLSIKEGTGQSPLETETVKLHYRSALLDDKEVDSTYKRGGPEEAQVNQFIKCLNEGVQLMKPGGRARIVCPPETALGKEGSGLVPPNATLVYDAELVEVVKEKQ